MPTTFDPQLDRVAKKVSHFYARRCWWADPNDLLQEARLAVERAKRTFDPTRGDLGYFYRAAKLAVANSLWRDSSPVSGDVYRPKGLEGKHRVELTERVEELALDPPTFRIDLKMGPPSPELTVDTVRWRVRLQIRVRELLEDNTDTLTLAYPVLVEDQKPAEVAKREGVPVRRVYLATQRARYRISGDETINQIWSDRDAQSP